MTRYQVVLKGTRDPSPEGQRAFFEGFGRSYQMSADQARDWVSRSQGVVYVFDDQPRAESARQFLAGLGGIAEVVAVEAPPGWPGPAAAAPSSGIRNYIKITNLADLIRDSFQLLFAHIVTLMVLMILPLLPLFPLMFGAAFVGFFAAMMDKSGSAPPKALIAVGVAVLLVILPIIIYFVFYAVTAIFIAISEAAQGGKPEIMATLKKVQPMVPVKLFVTQLVAGLLGFACLMPGGVVLGLLALITSGGSAENLGPGVIILGVALFLFTIPLMLYVAALFMFAQAAVVLENRGVIESFYRSKELGAGFYWRNLGVMILIGIVIGIGVMMVSLVLNFIPILGPLASMVIQNLASLIIYIVMILLYYEMRLRKEVKL